MHSKTKSVTNVQGSSKHPIPNLKQKYDNATDKQYVI
jgi:hypothetical protein